MNVYCFINKEKQFLAKKEAKLFFTDTEFYKMITYRRCNDAFNLLLDKNYFIHRNIDPLSLTVCTAEISIEIQIEHSWRNKDAD